MKEGGVGGRCRREVQEGGEGGRCMEGELACAVVMGEGMCAMWVWQWM